MDNTLNISAIAEPKGAKGLGKLLLPGAAALPSAAALSFEELLEASASELLAQAPGLPLASAAAEVTEQVQDEAALGAAVELALGVVPVADAPAPSNMLQMWQGWLGNAANATPAPHAQGTGAAEAPADVAALSAEPRARQTGPAVQEAPFARTREEQALPAPSAGQEEASAAEEFVVPGSVAANPLQERTTVLEPRASENDIQQLAGAAQAETRKPHTAPIQVASIPVPLRAPEWSNAFAEQMVLTVNDGGGRVELRLNPVELGPIEVSLNVQDDRVQASFTIQHTATVEAVQAALPRLEQMLAERGVQLERVSVEAGERRSEQGSQQANNGGAGAHSRRDGGQGGKDDPNAQPGRRVMLHNGLVDTFA